MNGVIEEHRLEASYVARDANSQTREFQSKVSDFFTGIKRVCVLDAPTGAGKTFAFKNLGTTEKKVLIVLPNNLLAKEVVKDLGSNAVLITGDTIQEKTLQRKRIYDPNYNPRSESIDEMIETHTYIITNPTVFYYLLINHYSQLSKEDMLATMIKRNIKTIIFDEFHIYSKDQISMIMASVLVVPNTVKIMFSSATPPQYFIRLCEEVFGSEKVEEINVKRIYNNYGNSDLIQGAISLKIVNRSAYDFITENLDLLKDGNWVIITDSIKSIDKIGKILNSNYPNDNIVFISAYYDPSYANYNEIRFTNKVPRIIVSSNIVEQGINIRKEYQNFIIEPGMTPDNTTQRLGRVGRGQLKESNVYLCFPSKLQSFGHNVNSMDILIEILKSLQYSKRIPEPTCFGIGVYVTFLIEKLGNHAREIVFNNIINYDNKTLNAGIYSCRNVNRTLDDEIGRNKIKSNCILQINKIYNWWKHYRDTIYDFIPSQADKVDVLDTDIQFSTNTLSTKYDRLWIHKNKNIIERNSEGYIVGNFTDKPNYDFYVLIKNIPTGGTAPLKYKDIAFKSWKHITEEVNKALENSKCPDNEKIQILIRNIKECTRETAGIERLIMEVINDT